MFFKQEENKPLRVQSVQAGLELRKG